MRRTKNAQSGFIGHIWSEIELNANSLIRYYSLESHPVVAPHQQVA